MGVSRPEFLRAVIGAGAAASVPLHASAAPPVSVKRVSHALVLSGGGALGAYQAGIVAALSAASGSRDGQPLAPYGFICGTSIGALNGWMIATGQYSRLYQMWNSIASQNIFVLKREFAKLKDPDSGIITRLMQGISLQSGLRTDLRGVLDSEPVVKWLKSNVDPSQPVLLPFAWTSTNLTQQRTEYFYRVPRQIPEGRKEELLAAFRTTIGPSAVLREVPDEQLHLALFASAAIPVAFDPVELPGPDGKTNQYVDGGVASNTPVGLARTVAQRVQAILLDPPFQTETYDNVVDILFGVYGTMQRRLLENDIRAAFLQSVEHTTFNEVAQVSEGLGLSPDDVAMLQRYFAQASHVELSYIRPQKRLPLRVGSFSDGPNIDRVLKIGEDAGHGGFTRYTLADFLKGNA